MGIRVIDTDVWSYLYKGSSEAKLYEPHLFGNILVISFQTEAELLRGALAANWGRTRRQYLESRLQKVCNRTLFVPIVIALGRSDGQRKAQWPPDRRSRCMDSRNRSTPRRASHLA